MSSANQHGQPNQQQKTSTCDFECDCFVSDFQQQQQDEDAINPENVLNQRPTQVKPKTSPDLVGRLNEIQQQRRKMIQQWEETQIVDEPVEQVQSGEDLEEAENGEAAEVA